MNKKMIFLIILSLFISVSTSSGFMINDISVVSEKSDEQWIIKGIELTSDGSHYIDMTIDKDNDLFISYYDRDLKSLKVAFIRGGNTIIDVVDSDNDVGLYSSIIVDSNDCLHVSYYDSTNNDLKYAYWNGSTWNIEMVDATDNVGLYTCIDVDSFNKPHISYYDASNGDLKYCYWDGTKWNIEIVDENGDIGIGTSLVIDSNDTPHISYTDEANRFLYYAKKVNSNWETIFVDDDCTIFASTSIGIDLDNFAHIAYFDVGTSEVNWNLKHAYYDGAEWIDEIVDPDLKHFWNDWGVSICIDDLNRINIGYYSWYRWDLNYAYKKNDKWSIETVESDGDSGVYASIVVNLENYPIISYMSRSSIELRYAMKIQYSPDPPDKPNGPNIGKPDELYTFQATGFDFDGDDVKYGWDWGDESEIEWTNFYKTGETIEIEHSWSEKKTYNVKVIVVDINGYESYWSEPLKISISKVKNRNYPLFSNVLEKILEDLNKKI